MKKFNPNWIGAVLLVLAFGYSMYQVVSIEQDLEDDDKIVVTIAHWQLEPGYRDAMQQVIDDYNRLHADAGVEVRQMPVTERVYSQWVNTNIISGTAPDIIQKGKAKLALRGSVMSKYFISLSDQISQPNPYHRQQRLRPRASGPADNARSPRWFHENTDPVYVTGSGEQMPFVPDDLDPALSSFLRNAAWQETFIDGMRGGFEQDVQDYFAVPSSMAAQRIFYNRKLFVRARDALRADYREQGESVPDWLQEDVVEPSTLGQLLEICRGVRLADRSLIPIAGYDHTITLFQQKYAAPFMASVARPLDRDLSGSVDQMETWAAYQAGMWDFQTPEVRAYFRFIRELADQFATGFESMTRDQAMFLFSQQDAAMLATGSWDAGALFQQADRGDFELGIMDFPMPAEGEPYSEHVESRANEAQAGAIGAYSVYKRSRNVDWAVDFLRFLSSYRWNQSFNQEAQWIPCIVGTEPADRMRPFRLDPEGISPGMQLRFNEFGLVSTRFTGGLKEYLSRQIEYEQFASAVDEAAENPSSGVEWQWHKKYQNARNEVRNLERMLGALSSRHLMRNQPGAMANARRVMLRQISLNDGKWILNWYRELHDRPFPEY